MLAHYSPICQAHNRLPIYRCQRQTLVRAVISPSFFTQSKNHLLCAEAAHCEFSQGACESKCFANALEATTVRPSFAATSQVAPRGSPPDQYSEIEPVASTDVAVKNFAYVKRQTKPDVIRSPRAVELISLTLVLASNPAASASANTFTVSLSCLIGNIANRPSPMNTSPPCFSKLGN